MLQLIAIYTTPVLLFCLCCLQIANLLKKSVQPALLSTPDIKLPEITIPDINLFPKETYLTLDKNRFDVKRIEKNIFTFHEIYDKKYNTISILVETNDGDIVPLVNSYQR